MVVRNISNSMILGITLKGIRHPLLSVGTLMVFAVVYQYLGNIVVSGAVASGGLVCISYANAYYGLKYRLFNSKSSPDGSHKMYAHYNSGQRGRRYWVAEHDGVIIGGVGIQKQQKSTAGKSGERRTTVAELKRMAVEPEYRRMGVAKALLDTAIEFAKQQGYDVIILDTSEIQQEAMRFYLKCGFEEIGVTRCDTVFPLFSYNLHNFRLRLNKKAQVQVQLFLSTVER
ncbi:uncharacterized protein LOC112042394 [Lingula anatina]|uniref:Uncharacterized protein LOC112042394 n=1 Tax=Lingula anatina TaxID=7574 RepID=A0A2R2MQX3_LINAN|nr:uncharacterized protein LOC112042394 [Lingula anatina]|eukprot:XP_023932654.1 uncharacterized protein LOC112042394 [Lingula anatina]